MRRLLDLMIVLCLPGMLWGQGSRFDSNIVTSANSVPYGAQSTLYTVPFAVIKVCAYPAAGNPCTNVVNVYSDPGLTQPITQPITADVHGRFGFWAAPGEYSYNAQSPLGTNFGNFTFTLAGTGGGSATFPSTPGLVYSLNTSTARNGTVADVTALFSGCSGTLFLRADGTCGGAGLSLTTTGTGGLATLSGTTLNVPNYTVTVPIITALGTLTNDISGSAAKIGGVAISGVPGVGQVPVALSSTTASWQTVGTSPGGSDTQVQFNDGGAFAGGANFTWNKATNVLALGGTSKISAGNDPASFFSGAYYNFAQKETTPLGTSNTEMMYLSFTPNYSADEAYYANAFGAFVQTPAGYTHSLKGLEGATYFIHNYGDGNVGAAGEDGVKGFTSDAGNDGAGIVRNLMAADYSWENTGTGSATNAYAIWIESPSFNLGNNNVTNAYGIYINDVDRGTNRYNLYSAGSASHNKFEGDVTANGIIDSALTPSTSPICPNGTGGALTTSGCDLGIIGRYQATLGTGSLTSGTCSGITSSAFSGGSSTTTVVASLYGPEASLTPASLNGISIIGSFSSDTHKIQASVCNNSGSSWTYTGLGVNFLVQ